MPSYALNAPHQRQANLCNVCMVRSEQDARQKRRRYSSKSDQYFGIGRNSSLDVQFASYATAVEDPSSQGTELICGQSTFVCLQLHPQPVCSQSGLPGWTFRGQKITNLGF